MPNADKNEQGRGSMQELHFLVDVFHGWALIIVLTTVITPTH